MCCLTNWPKKVLTFRNGILAKHFMKKEIHKEGKTMKNKKTKYILLISLACVALLVASVLLFIGDKKNSRLKNELNNYAIKIDFINLHTKIELISAGLKNMDIKLEQLIDLRDELNDCLKSLLEAENAIYTIEQLENVKDIAIATEINIKMTRDVDFANYCNGLMEKICNDFSNDSKNAKTDFDSYIREFEKLLVIIDNYTEIIDEEYITAKYENIKQTIFLMLITDKEHLNAYKKENRLWQGIPSIEVTKGGVF